MIKQYKKFLLYILILTIFFAAAYHLFSYDIELSVPSGFYDDAFSLHIEGGALFDIYYTLDGSEPTINSIPYEKGSAITITDASANKNIYSMRTDISTGYLSELIEKQDGTDHGYTVPNHNVDKCTILRAAVFDAEGNMLDSAYGVYFVGFQKRNAYKD